MRGYRREGVMRGSVCRKVREERNSRIIFKYTINDILE